MEMDFGSEENASIVYAALAVDKEATEARFLRASFSAFVDVLTLATKTIEEFGQGMKL
ncbi:hypothetical protein JHK84_040063 [Glycine max]|nr:hypothetical protein JHK86_039852 [Glycine max]KAG4965458.1 hypothetical protein JHK85_040433 [Glycine max]KAG5121723.1 hypothetical protein JHK84_040063 [Glycine max]